MVLTGRTALIALICALPVTVSTAPRPVFWALAAALLVAVVVDVVLAGSPAAARFVRSGDSSARLGEPVSTTLDVTNAGSRRLRGRFRDAWPPSARAVPRSLAIDIPAGGSTRVSTELRPVRRGELQAAMVTVRAVGPLGLAGRQRSTPVPGAVGILPPFLSRKHLPSRLAKLREIDGMLPVLIRGQGTEFDSLREYVAGDDIRSIDWRATARRTETMVRTWRPERDRRVFIVLDTGRTAAGRVGVDPTAGDPAGWPRLDWSMDAVLLLAALATRAGDHVDLLAHDRVIRASVSSASRTRLLSQLVEAMTPLEPALLESDAAAMVSAISRRAPHQALVVLLTDLNTAALTEGLLPVLPRLSARHPVILAAVADPRVDRLARGRSDAAAVYDAAAAERSRNDRRAVASRLRRGGVEVVDEAPDQLAPALADRYLAMKASGRL